MYLSNQEFQPVAPYQHGHQTVDYLIEEHNLKLCVIRSNYRDQPVALMTMEYSQQPRHTRELTWWVHLNTEPSQQTHPITELRQYHLTTNTSKHGQ